MSLENDQTQVTHVFQKLAGFQAIIPEFNANSVVTPKFFLDNIENVTNLAKCSPEEKLLILRSRIRGEALSHVINSPDLAQETDYNSFKQKFLDYFDKKISLATRHQHFASCRMKPDESVKVYAARVSDVTQKFFGNCDLTIPAVKTLFEQSKLSKFLEGLTPDFKWATLMKDPSTLNEAINFVELLQNSTESSSATSNDIAIGNICSNNDLLKLIECHTQNTQGTIAALTKEIQNLKVQQSENSESRLSRRDLNNRGSF